MSYCVNCGVELAESEKECPLCKVPVMNPKNPWKEPDKRPYPQLIEEAINSIDLRFGGLLATLILLLPCAVTIVCNFAINGCISWSLYIVGACSCLFVWVILPILFKKWKPYLFVLCNCIATSLYVFLISRLTGTMFWFLPLALPILVSASFMTFIITFTIRRKKLGVLTKVAISNITIGVLSVIIEIVLNDFLNIGFKLYWSSYVFIVCLICGIAFLILERRKRWKDEIKRRLFM